MDWSGVVAAAGLAVAPGTVPAELELRPEPRAARTARAWVRQQVPPLDEESAQALELLTSELVTNAVLHARTRLSVGVAPLVGGLLVTVADRNLLPPTEQPYSETRTSGRGLALLEGLARRWGVTTGDNGKTVWFVLDAAEAYDPVRTEVAGGSTR